MDERNTSSPRLSRRDDYCTSQYRDEQSMSRQNIGVQTEQTSMEKMLGQLYLDSQIPSPYIPVDRRGIETFIDGFEGFVDNQGEEACSGAAGIAEKVCGENKGDDKVRPKVAERARKIGRCSDHLLNVVEDVNNRYIRDYQVNNYGVVEKQKLSPIVEKKLNLSVQDGNDVAESIVEKARGIMKKISLGRLSRQESKGKMGEISTTSPNIEKMLKDLLIRHQTEECEFQAIDLAEVERKLHESNDKLAKHGKKSVGERTKSSFFHFFSHTKRTRSVDEKTEQCTVGIELEGEAVGSDDVTGFWEDVCFTPRTDHKYNKRKMSMRRNSSPDVLLRKLKKKLILKDDSPKEKRGLIKGERIEKCGSGKPSRQNSRDTPTPERSRKLSKHSRQSSRDTPTPEQIRSQSKQVSRQSSREVSTPERRRSQPKRASCQSSRDMPTPECKRSQSKQASRQNSHDIATPESKRSQTKQASRQNSHDKATPERKRSQTKQASQQNSYDKATPERKRSQTKQASRQNSYDKATPERKRSQTKQASRQNNRDIATPESKWSQGLHSRDASLQEQKRVQSQLNKKGMSSATEPEGYRSTPKVDRKGDQSRDRNDKKPELQRTASTPEMYRRSSRRQKDKSRSRTSSTPSLRRKPCKHIRDTVCTRETERRTTKHTEAEEYRNRTKTFFVEGRGSSVDGYDWQGTENSHSFFLSLMSKKSSFSKKKQNSKDADDEVEQLNSGPVDPVYSLLKCAADLPRSGGKSPCLVHPHCSGQHSAGYSRYPSGGDSSGNTSKTSSPSSSVLMDSYNPSKHPSLESSVPVVIEPPVGKEASHSPKSRRKKLNARMKSFSLDTPEPPKQLLGIDETTKKKSSSFTNTCFGGKESPDEKLSFSAANLRKKFALGRASSLETDDKKHRSYTPSPKESPKSQRKEREKANLYVALYNFKAKEKDDMDLRPGWRVTVTDSSKKDWWKGKSHGKSGYFPATYVIPLLPDQRVFQILQPLNLSDGMYAIKFHKDQIVLQVGEEVEGMILIRAANNRQAMCPLLYLQEL